MSNVIGVLGQSVNPVSGTSTVYTCPAGKAAKVRLMFLLRGNAAGGTIVEFFVNGMSIARVATMTPDYYTFTVKGGGLRVAEQSAAPTGIGAALTAAPADPIYFLSANDTVTYVISGADAALMNCQVVGAEIDVA